MIVIEVQYANSPAVLFSFFSLLAHYFPHVTRDFHNTRRKKSLQLSYMTVGKKMIKMKSSLRLCGNLEAGPA